MIDTVGVVVPAADEQDLLPACLDAVEAARRELARRRPDVAVRVVVVLDSCTDGSAEVVRTRAGVEAASINERLAGAARNAGCALVVDGSTPAQRLWLACTDADSRVPQNWLTGMVELAEAGADFVLGTVRPAETLPAGVAATYRAAYISAEGHPHVHGANLGIRAATYLKLGGWPRLGSGEDVALASRAMAAGVPTIRTSRFPVATSTRLAARAPYGYSSYLRGLAAPAQTPVGRL